MLKVDRESRTFQRLEEPTLKEASILERTDLQEWIFNSSEAFFQELGEKVFVLGQEIAPSKTVQDRIDLLVVDAEGAVIIVELKRGSNKLQMLQAISYAGMISRWKLEDFRHLVGHDETWDALTDFLDVEIDDINRNQRLMLVAEGFDYALLAGAEWLSESFGVDVRCASVTLATDRATGAEYLACANVFPAPAIVEQAVARGRGGGSSRPIRWENWQAALASIENADLRAFATEELEGERENYLRRRSFHFRLHGKRRWSVGCRRKAAYVWQRGRFEGDEEFWRSLLSDPSLVKPVKRGVALSFNLSTAEDLSAFRKAAKSGLQDAHWYPHGYVPGDDDESDE